MKRKYLVFITLVICSSCTHMSAGVRDDGIHINNAESVVKGTPTYVGREIKNFKKEMAQADFWASYGNAVISGDTEKAARIKAAIDAAEAPKPTILSDQNNCTSLNYWQTRQAEIEANKKNGVYRRGSRRLNPN